MWLYIILFVSIVTSLFVGIRIGKLSHKRFGTINIDHSDTDGPFIFLELSCPLEELEKHKTVLMDIDNKDYIRK